MEAKGRLLVIDDDPEVAGSVERIAVGCGLSVRIARDPDDFFRQLSEWQPTQIVLDLQMPGVDGIEILRRLGDTGNPARIILASGVDGRIVESVRGLGVEHGLNVVGALLKPFRAAELRQMLIGGDGIA